MAHHRDGSSTTPAWPWPLVDSAFFQRLPHLLDPSPPDGPGSERFCEQLGQWLDGVLLGLVSWLRTTHGLIYGGSEPWTQPARTRVGRRNLLPDRDQPLVHVARWNWDASGACRRWDYGRPCTERSSSSLARNSQRASTLWPTHPRRTHSCGAVYVHQCRFNELCRGHGGEWPQRATSSPAPVLGPNDRQPHPGAAAHRNRAW